MPPVPVFQTNPDQEHTEISGLPTLPANGKGGVTVEQAAQVMPQLQDDDGKPLTGAALTSAAKALAAETGVVVGSVSDAKAAKLAQLNGAAEDRPPAAEVAVANYEALHGPLERDAAGTPDPDPDPSADAGANS